jgi:hypothetical protein
MKKIYQGWWILPAALWYCVPALGILFAAKLAINYFQIESLAGINPNNRWVAIGLFAALWYFPFQVSCLKWVYKLKKISTGDNL